MSCQRQSTPAKPPKPEELEKALEDIGYVIDQTFEAFVLFHQRVAPMLNEKEIKILKSASLEAQLLFLRKLNEFFMPLPLPEEQPLKEADLRAEHYTGFTGVISRGPFLSKTDKDELNKRVGHITLMEVRHGKKDWAKLISTSMPVAIERMIDFCRFLRDKYQPPLSNSTRETVKGYVQTLEQFARIWPMP